jgi:hypothetical protein
VPDRRTILVLGSLVIGMTLVSGLLLVLEPGPVAPPQGVSLMSSDRGGETQRPEDVLFSTQGDADWRAIVIHDSGALQGSYESINRAHERLGRQGNGYHFVINNGTGDRDGRITTGYRWENQLSGAYLEGQGADWFNEHGIGVCMIGDMDRQRPTEAQLHELVWLVRQMQQRLGVPAENVFVSVGAGSEPAAHFPHAWFADQLIERP